ncbi:PAS domain-containing protein [Thioploca ingrica]|uniref:histidine kinase n=1 Tax=Thioploca ingrica TaxID=40754 RepID=A0A090AJI7_9GAMM|nr:PAS domain-containing protein [Thioploca ingrica]
MRYKYKMTVLLLVIGSIFSITGFITVRQLEQQKIYFEMTKLAPKQIWSLQNALQNMVEMLHTLANFYAINPDGLDRQQFNTVTTPILLRHPYLFTLIWAPRVPHNQRSHYESMAQANYPQFRFTEHSSQEEFITASLRNEYFPIYYATSLNSIEHIYGFDLQSNYLFAQLLSQAKEKEILQATSRVKWIVDNSVDQDTILVFYPIYQKKMAINTGAQQQKYLRGFLVTVIRLKSLVQQVLEKSPHRDDFNLQIEDESASPNERLLYADSSSEKTLPAYQEPFEFAGRVWLITAFPKVNDSLLTQNWLSFSILIGGLAITVLMSRYLYTITQQTQQLQIEIAQRRRAEIALQQAEESLIEYNLTLEQQVSERIQELAEKNSLLQQKIQERQQAEQTLHDSTRHFNTILDNLPAFICLYASDRRIQFANRYFYEKIQPILTNFEQQLTAPAQASVEELAAADVFEKGLLSKVWEQPLANNRTYQIYEYPFVDSDGSVLILKMGIDITQHKQLEKALRASEERFELAMRGANDGLWDWNLETNELYLSPRWKSMLGYQDQELVNHFDEWSKRIHPDDLTHAIGDIEAYLDRKKPTYENTQRICHKNGHYVWILDRGIAVWNKEGKPTRFIGIRTDITAQKQAEAALRNSQERINRFFELPLIGMAITSPTKGWLEVNDKLCEMLGYSREELKQQTWSALTHPDDLAADSEQFNRLLSHQIEGYSRDKRYIHKNGNLVYTTLSLRCVRSTQGEVDYLVVLIQDITERKQAEKKLREQEEFLRLLIDNIPQYVFWKDIHSVFLGCNRRFAYLIQVNNPAEIIGKTEFELLREPLAQWLHENDSYVMSTNRALYHHLEEVIWSDGQSRWFETNKIPLHDAQGKVIGILGTSEDITERRRVELVLREYNQTLEREVAERTQALRKQDTFLRLVLDNIPQLISWKDINLVFLGCNQRVAQFANLNSTDDIIGKTDFDLIWRDYAEHFQHQDRQVIETNTPIYHAIDQVLRSDGRLFWWEVNKIPLYDDSGKVVGVLGTVEDITAHKQAEDALKQAHERFKIVLNSLNSAVYVSDMQTNEILFVNHSIQKLFAQELVGTICWQTLQPVGQSAVCDFCTNSRLISTTGQPTGVCTWEYHNKRLNKWFYVQDCAIPWDDGHLVRLSVATDITERKQTEDKLREREARLKAIFDNAATGIVLINMKGQIIQCNTKWLEMTGYTPAAIGSLSYFSLIHLDDIKYQQNYYKQLINKEIKSYQVEQRLLKNNGELFWVNVSVTAIYDSTEMLEALVGIMVDITERKQVESALRQSEERFDLAMQGSNDGLWDWNLDTDSVYFSPRWKQMIGFQEQEMSNRFEELINRIHPDDSSLVLAKIEDYLSKKTPVYEVQFRLQHKEGHFIWILSRGIAVWNKQGIAYRFIGTHMDLTAQKQAEQALRESEIYWRNLIEGALIGLLLVDTQGKIIEANPAYAHIVGYPLEELYQLTIWDITPKKYFSLEQKQLHLLKTTGRFGPIEKEYIHKHNYLVPVRLSGLLVTRKGKHLIWCNVEDITDQKQAKAKLQNAYRELARFKTILDITLDSLFMFDDETYRFLYVNQGAIQQFGYSAEELLQKTLLDLRTELATERFETVVNTLRNHSQPTTTFETTLQYKEGNQIPVEIFLQYIQIPGQVKCFVAIMRNISERKQMEQALRQSKAELEITVAQRTQELQEKQKLLEEQQKFTALVENSNDVIGISTLEGQVSYLNKAGRRLVGLEQNQRPLEKTQLTDYLAESLRPLWQQAIFPKVLQQEHWEGEVQLRHFQTGQLIETHSNVFIVRHPHTGIPLCLATVTRDITEQKRASIQLQQAKEAAEAANRAKSTFLANMSHELRTPLNGILGYTQILSRDRTLSNKHKQGIHIIERSGHYLLTLINDILDLSKIEAGKLELYPVDFNFIHFIQSITEIFQVRAQQKGITFIYEPLSSLPMGIHADDKRLRQILLNLLGNAIKFTHQGQVKLQVGYDKNKVRFQVEDTGIGIAAAEIDKIFLPFQQVGDPTYRIQGTGLGLAITKKLVELMGSELQVDSVLGQGSLFRIELELPAVVGLETTEPLESQALITGYRGRDELAKRYKILVIDDQLENRLVIVNLLTPLGFEVIEAPHGQEGLDKVQTESPNLIILDLIMPVMNGFEFVQQLRQISKYKEMVVIATSASVFNQYKEESLSAGCNEFIAKPIRAEILFNYLQRYLPLEWIYESVPKNNLIAEHNDNKALFSSIALPSQVATQLFELTQMGDINGIIEQAQQLQQLDERFAPLAARIIRLAQQFEDEKISELVKPYLASKVEH